METIERIKVNLYYILLNIDIIVVEDVCSRLLEKI